MTRKQVAIAPRKIVTSFVYPPIPWREIDWSAHYDGDEESGFRGWGKTEAEAIADLKQEEATQW